MAQITVKQAVATFIKIREAKAVKERELKEWKAGIKAQEEALEKFIKREMASLDITTIGSDGNTASQHEKDFVSISNKDTFKTFLATQMLTALQPHLYRDMQGEWQPDGKADLAEHVEKLVDSGAFDLITLSANKTNCKDYMAENKGLMPDGIKYEKEIVIQIRKGKK